MIRPIDITLNAAHPELPLCEATTFTGAPSSVFIRGVPKSVGNWSITAVNVSVTYPDNTTTTRAAVESAEGVWVATIPGTATSGRTPAGFRITANGIDENGAAVTGYVLGFADFAVFSFLPVPAPGETYWIFRYFDTLPTAAKKMDATIIGGVLRYFNGTTWQPFADLTNYYTKTETDEQIDRVAAYYITYNAQGANFPTRAALDNATTYYSGGVERVPTRNDYAVVMADETHDGAEWQYIYAVPEGETTGQWEPQYPIETNDYEALSNKPQINGNTLTGNKTSADLGLQAALTAQQLANIAAVPDKADASALPYALVSITYSSGVQLANRTTTKTTIAAPGSGSTTAASFTMPAPIPGKSRDFMLDLTFGADSSSEGDINLSFVEPTPAGGTAPSVVIKFGNVDDVAIGRNILLFSEVPSASASETHWLITARHEDFAP